jgi:hypothetical protein
MWLSGNQRAFQVMVASGWMGAGAPGSRPSIPMAWVGTRAAKAASLQRMLGLAVRGRGPPVGHGYKNVKGQGTVTTPWRDRQLER